MSNDIPCRLIHRTKQLCNLLNFFNGASSISDNDRSFSGMQWLSQQFPEGGGKTNSLNSGESKILKKGKIFLKKFYAKIMHFRSQCSLF